MKRERKRGCGFGFGILVLGLFCILVLVAAIVIIGLPETLAKIGSASEALDPIQKASLAGYLLFNLGELDTPVGDPDLEVELEVQQGDSASIVVSRLETMGLLEEGTLLKNYLRYRGLDTSIEAGRYLLHGAMSVREVAEALQSAKLQQVVFTVIEGWRREQIAEALERSGVGIPADEFIHATQNVANGHSILEGFPPSATLEGFLFPDTYSLDMEVQVEDLVTAMLDAFQANVTDDLRTGFQTQGLTLHQAITLASIVEREAVVPEERELIASVFLNRLSLGMNLEADPTVQYALGRQEDGGWWKALLSLQDLEFDSLYNTYRYPGLPPGPIANPGLHSIRAVAFPATTTYLYFRAQCDGSGRHSFAVTFEEHQMNACE
jgi:UPF0755 protein